MNKQLPVAFALALCGGSILFGADSEKSKILLHEDFNKDNDKGFAARILRDSHVTLAKGAGPDGSDAIRVAYVGSKRGSERVVERHPLASKVDQATLSFDVRFDRDFQWTRGGKLHGLAPKTPITGGKKRRPDGWSARIMFKKDGKCATYLYDQSKKRKYGRGSTSAGPAFKAGRWHHVVLEVKLNDPGKDNGFARIRIDNKPVVSSEKMVFRGSGGGETLIQTFLFNTFHGGSSPKWAPVDKEGKPTTVHAWFDNFRVTEGVR